MTEISKMILSFKMTTYHLADNNRKEEADQIPTAAVEETQIQTLASSAQELYVYSDSRSEFSLSGGNLFHKANMNFLLHSEFLTTFHPLSNLSIRREKIFKSNMCALPTLKTRTYFIMKQNSKCSTNRVTSKVITKLITKLYKAASIQLVLQPKSNRK